MSKPDKPKERPILFSGPMVRAIQEDRKTQTRRVMTPQPISTATFAGYKTDLGYPASRGFFWAGFYANGQASSSPGYFKCRAGLPGTRLWVRESWQALRFGTDPETGHVDEISYPEKIPVDANNGVPLEDKFGKPWWQVGYKAADCWADESIEDRGFPWRPSIHMPRWASRINLEVVKIRVEKLQDISEADAKAEGVEFRGGYWLGGTHPVKKTLQCWPTAKMAFEKLWDSINAKRGLGWDTNPWVWVVEFKKVEA